MQNLMSSQKGFTLIETIVALGILTVGILSLYSMQITSIQGNATANRITQGTSWGANQIESELLVDLKDIPSSFTGVGSGASWSQIVSLDTTGDGQGTVQDPDRNGIDDTAVDGVLNFGLDNTVGPVADFTRPSPDGRFTFYYNFAINVPMPRVVTIRVIVQENNTGTAPVVMTYMKDDII